MTINPFNVEEYIETARTRVTEQFKDAAVFDKYMQLLIQGLYEIELVFKDLMQLRSIDTAVGAQLDLLGNIVGQDRNIASKSFVTAENPSGNITLDDVTYRVVIKSRIRKNISVATPEDVISAASFILSEIGGTQVETRIREGNASAQIYVGRRLKELEKVLIKGYYTRDYLDGLLPRPLGVRFESYISYQQDNFFAFREVKGAKGFGSRTDPSVDGGYFAERI